MSPKVTIPISMDLKTDVDLLEWLKRQENRSAAVREALRAYLRDQVVTAGDVLRAVEDLRRDIESRTIAIAFGGPGETVEREEIDPGVAAAQAALDGLEF